MTKQRILQTLMVTPLRLSVFGLLLVASSVLPAEEKPATTAQSPQATDADASVDSSTAPAVDKNSLEFMCRFPPIEKKPLQGKQAPPDRTQLQADEADMSNKDITHFSGSVIIQRENRRIELTAPTTTTKLKTLTPKAISAFLMKVYWLKGKRPI